MADTTKPLEINDILALIQSANKSLETPVYVPSLGKEINAKTLNANHTKNLVKSTVSGPFSSNQFVLVMYNILRDILEVPPSQLNTYDKAVILLDLRAKNINHILAMKLDAEAKEVKPIDYNLNLTKFINKQKKERTFSPEIVENAQYIVTLNYPTIEEEYQFENHLFKTKLSTIKEDDQKALRDLSGPFYLYTIAQYVKAVDIGETKIDLTAKNINERLAIVESLSAGVIHKIIDKIDSVFGKNLSALTTVEKTEDEVKYTGHIDLDASLFIVN